MERGTGNSSVLTFASSTIRGDAQQALATERRITLFVFSPGQIPELSNPPSPMPQQELPQLHCPESQLTPRLTADRAVIRRQLTRPPASITPSFPNR